MNLRSAAKSASFSLLAFGFITVASANITLNTTGVFAVDSTGPNNSGNYFWNNPSSDGTTCNVGYFLEKGASGCGNVQNLQSNFTGLGTNLDFLAKTTTGAATAPSFYFTGTGLSTLLVTITGNSNESIGYTDSTGDHLLAAKGSGSTTATITASGPFDFYLSVNGVRTYDTVSSPQQFALFAPGVAAGTGNGDSLSTFYLGAEDAALPGGDKDYNDVIIQVTSTPEPGFYGALATGFAGLMLAVKRRRKA